MAAELDDQTLVAKWETFFALPDPRRLLQQLTDLYPDLRSFHVRYAEIERFDPDLAEFLLLKPNKAIYFAEEVLRRALPPEKVGGRPHFRVRELPRDWRIDIRQLRAKNLGQYVAVEGLVRKATEVRPRVTAARFQCMRCNAILHEAQEGLHFHEPLECYKDQGGCGRAAGSTKFKLLTEESVFVDTQKIEMQEAPEGLRGGAEPQRLVGYFEDDITGRIAPGDRVTLNGIIRSEQKGAREKSTLFDIHLEVYSVEYQEHEYEEIVISPEDERAIEDLARSPDIFTRVVASISPTIYGYELEKEALALQLFGGVPKVMDDGTRIRGDIHVLLVGDPGVAKSQLLRYMASLAPRGIYAAGMASTAAGLTAAAVKDEFGEGRWTLEAGALVLADLGLAAVDEIDKMNPIDRSSIHEALEQGTVSVAKAGLTATLQARCAVLGAANPKYGRFDENSNLADQIDLPPALLSRFDAIFAMTDKPAAELDAQVAVHILRAHRRGEVKKYVEIGPPPAAVDLEKVEQESQTLVPVIDRELLRKYVAYSKRVVPVLSDEAMGVLQQYYVSIRKLGEAEGVSVPITARQLEAFVRLSEASARARLSSTVDLQDAQRAIKIVEYYLSRVAMEGGRFDIDLIATGTSRSQRDHLIAVRRIIQELAAAGGRGANEDDVLLRASDLGIPEERVREMVRRLRERGEIYSSAPGFIRLVSEE